MSRVIITPSVLKGTLKLPLSKSDAHRAEICSFLSGGAELIGRADSDDINATRSALEALRENKEIINCGESGSTLRFLIPVASALGKTVTFTGRGRLPERPIGEYLRLLPAHGVSCEYGGTLPLTVSGRLKSGVYELRGDISSQYISGLLFALPLLDGDSEIRLTSPLQSAPYVDMTLNTMERFGVYADKTPSGWLVKGNQSYKKCRYEIEGDWSQAAFFLVGGALTGTLELEGVNLNSAQGDKEIINALKRFGADIEINGGCVKINKSLLHASELDVSDIPDTVPALAALAAYAEGKTVITGAERLRIKESDRINSVVTNLKKMGINAEETPDGMIIEGGTPRGAELDGCNDHRIVMAFSVAALAAEGETVITDAQSINKSYPGFFRDFCAIGGKANVICNGK
ncbi:MAG: 3-phosphoshikimate 1-carboxyvinyltransferase [Eubacterium sp.]|nr:3-phosphoshikimate 1-carboxyvinyltransferase [Eubacterium sp.]